MSTHTSVIKIIEETDHLFNIQKQTAELSSDCVCVVLLTHLVPGIEAQVLVTLFTVMVSVVGCVFRELNPTCPPAQVHALLAHRVFFARKKMLFYDAQQIL